ncbi:hypothetical protein, partial [Paenibacillus amylolyticus]|uniref:hypothetical protein n=1 Tax=Paenibacillus amylolyticus TaxID=1451 RepID=UPI003398D7BA
MMASAWQKLFSPQKLQLETLHLTIGLSWLIFYHLDYYCLPATNLIFPVKMPDDDMITPRLILTKNTKKPPQGRFLVIPLSSRQMKKAMLPARIDIQSVRA